VASFVEIPPLSRDIKASKTGVNGWTTDYERMENNDG